MKITLLFLLFLFIASFANKDSLRQARLEELKQRRNLPDSTWDYSWENFAAYKCSLDEKSIECIRRDHLLITNEAFKQVYEPYLFTRMPVFVTSDALLYAYHVLLEESMVRLEEKYSCSLGKVLREIWATLPAQKTKITDKSLEQEAFKRGRIIIGTALWLLGENVESHDKGVMQEIRNEVRKISRASVVEKPKWLGKPDTGFMAIDYSRFKVRGLYTRNKQLSQYAKAVSWLQSIPFRIDHDVELVSIFLLGSAYQAIYNHDYEYGKDKRFVDYTDLIGAEDAWDLEEAGRTIQGNLKFFDDTDIKKYRQRLWESAVRDFSSDTIQKNVINDQLRFAPLTKNGIIEPHFRILAPLQTPDAVLYQKLGSAGLPVSPMALLFLEDSTSSGYDAYSSAPARKIINGTRSYFECTSIYHKYLKTLRALVAAPEPDAPDFMRGHPWKRKSENTFLAGYALLKHATALHSKQYAYYLGATMVPPGFVEPNPEFWRLFTELCNETGLFFEKRGTFETDFTALINAIEKSKKLVKDRDFMNCLLDNECGKCNEEITSLADLIKDLTMADWWNVDSDSAGTGAADSLLSVLDSLGESFKTGRHLLNKRIINVAESENRGLWDDWKNVAALSREIQVLAHKQLRKRPFSETENTFLKGIGPKLGSILQYKGNSYLTPRDDAPRIMDIAANPNNGTYLAIGVCRPRSLYVLYPWNGIEILCRGVVLPYYEFWSKKRLNDSEWRTMLDSSKRPSIPHLLKKIVAKEKLEKPKTLQHD